MRNTQVKVAADDLSELDPNVDSEGDEDEDESGEANSESDQDQEGWGSIIFPKKFKN